MIEEKDETLLIHTTLAPDKLASVLA